MNYNKQLVYRAGTIPYIVEDGVIKMLFMQPSNPEFGGSEFQIAKGRIEEGEETRAAAIREAKEELGLFIGNTSLVEELGTFMGRTTVFVAKVNEKDLFGEPDFETEATRWMTVEEFLEDGRILHKPVVLAAARLIERIEARETNDSSDES